MYHFTKAPGREIAGRDYENLIRHGILNCTHFSLVFGREQLFTHYPFPVVPYLCRAVDASGERYRCDFSFTTDAICFIRDKNLFAWRREDGGPEDMTFYREDGSVFFRSATRQGECWLYPREGEYVGDIVSRPGWEEIAAAAPGPGESSRP